MLMGEYPHSIDSKNRLIIPSRIKEELGDIITIIRDADKCLCMYSEEEWNKYVEKLNELPKTKARAMTRFIFANATKVQPDSQGRILLPQKMVEYAGITKNVITVGCGKYAEIWSEERWNELDLDSEPENYAEMLEMLGL